MPQFSVTLAACLLFIIGSFKSAAITPPVIILLLSFLLLLFIFILYFHLLPLFLLSLRPLLLLCLFTPLLQLGVDLDTANDYINVSTVYRTTAEDSFSFR